VEKIFNTSLENLINWCEKHNFTGFDPYDTLNSPINFKVFGKWGPPVAIQIQKRNPINIRPFLAIKKGYNPKGMGLFLKAYSLLYKKTNDEKYLKKATWLFNWLNTNYSKGYSGKCWGYNFDWASPGSYLPAFTPSVVVTSFVVDGIFEYYKITKDELAKEAILSARNYISTDIPVTELPEGISFSYTHLSKGCCYNASLLAAEVLAKADFLEKTIIHTDKINKAIDFVLSKQKPDGEWWYSYNPEKDTERKQIDFHQGFVLISLSNLNQLLPNPSKDVTEAIEKGLKFYKSSQFLNNGQSLWRLPKKWPVDIHNQSQGIITFSQLREYDDSYFQFAHKIAEWTINNMQSKDGYFYYRKTPFFMNKIPYIRWSQAWMMLALAEIVETKRN
jgi:hypothetical protein